VDVWTLFTAGIVGYLFTKAGVPLAPMILGAVLGGNMETNLFRALTLSDWTTFFTRPISAILIVLTIASVIYSAWQSNRTRKKMKQNADAANNA
jgi:putative tricarboxylic transport membrane protein